MARRKHAEQLTLKARPYYEKNDARRLDVGVVVAVPDPAPAGVPAAAAPPPTAVPAAPLPMPSAAPLWTSGT